MTKTFQAALDLACWMMETDEYGQLEPTSALKQAAHEYGMDCDTQVETFIRWANAQLGF